MSNKVKIYSLEGFPETRAAPDWLIKGMIEVGSLCLIFGDPESGKSLIAIDMCCCVAHGLDFHGRSCKKGKVLYLAGEGELAISRRFRAWHQHHNLIHDPESIFICIEPQKFCNLGSKEIRKAMKDLPPVDLFIVDTLATNFGDEGTENDTADMGKFIRSINEIRQEFDCATLIVHHPGVADKSRGRGSMVLKASLDSEFNTRRTKNDHIEVSNTKMKDSARIEPLHLTIKAVPLGPENTSAIVVSGQASITPSHKSGRNTKLQNIFMSTLKTLMNGGKIVSERELRNLCVTEKGMARTSFYRIRDILSENGTIQIDNDTISMQ